MASATPTRQAYTELQTAYDYFNRRFFGSRLPPCLITMQRKNRTYGYFSGDRWANQSGDVRDEIAMNPMHFASRSVEDVLSTLAHEMIHLWQYHFGTPSRSGYHNKEWAAKMEAIGLQPSHTGKPGGKRTGQQMTHYILDGGPFAVSTATLLKRGFTISWMDRAREEAAGTANLTNTRTKYTCPICELNAWAKPDIELICGDCNEILQDESNQDSHGNGKKKRSNRLPATLVEKLQAQEDRVGLLDDELWKDKHFLELLHGSGAIADVFDKKVRLRLKRIDQVVQETRSFRKSTTGR